KQVARAQTRDRERARRTLVRRYVATVIAATPAMLARIFGWQREILRATLDDLLARRSVTKTGDWILKNDE
ncbi:MAG: hypothetical protein AB1817_20820, partial [Chloroflexota bacterium]